MNIDHTDLPLLGSSLNPAEISTGNVSDYEYIYIYIYIYSDILGFPW
jgi:hypothetical protein